MKNFEIGIATFFLHMIISIQKAHSIMQKNKTSPGFSFFCLRIMKKTLKKSLNYKNLQKKIKAKIICHSPHLLNLASQEETHAKNLCLFFPENQKKYAVFHFDENETIENALQTISFYNSFGIIVCYRKLLSNKDKRCIN